MPARKFPDSQIYLIHGNNETEVSDARYGLVCELLTPEERDAGLTEVTGPGNQPLTLQRALSEIIGELGTSSFLPGAKRVVVVYDLKELFGGGKKAAAGGAKKKPAKATAKKPEDSLVEWLGEVLPQTENVVVFVCNESGEKQRMVSAHSPLYRFIKAKGEVIERREKPLQYEFDSHLLAGNAAAAIAVFRMWSRRSGSDGGARLRMFSTLAGFIELVLQAKCVQEARARQVSQAQVGVQDGFPTLGKIPDWKAKKIHDFAGRLPLEAIQKLLDRTNRLQRQMYPTGEEAYVPNWEDTFELLILELTAIRR